ncbi:putative xylitol oxidase [Rhizocola hellebori]|uniref:Putative xylitol oxidase n=1 Tax=Rhizocola hellebori TaxID=1392758 RepID=A0A8J3Q4G6_9ACTN|nr:FAD-binding protein [Rhizocola hellebori]GIH03216.1 putative xylitol oxidase [Rhizocola hellebori]
MLTNWAGNVIFGAREFHQPSTVDEVRALVARSERIKAVGSGHSFSLIADTQGDLVSLRQLPPLMEIDSAAMTVKVAAGVRYGELAPFLHSHGYALANLGSLPHLSVAGATATATHGSGDRNGNLATSVASLDLVTAQGDTVTLDRASGAVVNLGALGIAVAVTLDIEPAFQISQRVYRNLPELDLDIFASAYSVSMFTQWRGESLDQVWVKERVGAQTQAWQGKQPAMAPMHPIAGMPADSCTPQLGEPGPWYERLPHFRLEHTPSAGDELQSEFFVPRSQAVQAFQAINGIRERVAAVLQISEIRTIAADELWMSPCYQRESVAFHFTWIKDPAAVLPVVQALEEELAPFEPRPHWGKVFTMRPAVHPGFAGLIELYDPAGKFRNPFLDRALS